MGHQVEVRTQLLASAVALAGIAIATPASAQGAGAALDRPTGSAAASAPATDGIQLPPAYGVASDPGAVPHAAAVPQGGYMPTWALLIPGLAAFLVPYAGGALAASFVVTAGGGGSDDAAWLFVPVAGAFYWAGLVSDSDVVLFAAMGISELAGIALIIAGIAINHRDGGSETPDPQFSFAPLVAPGLGGLSVSGTF